MFKKSVKSLSKKLEKLKAEYVKHEKARANAKPEDKPIHLERRRGVERELSKVNADLILARAAEALDKKKKK